MADQAKEFIKVGPRNFEVLGNLGKGGFSIVKKAKDETSGKEVALKIMYVKMDPKSMEYQQTCHEIKMMKKLPKHKNLVRLLGYDLHSSYKKRDCVILVQELCPNYELFDYLMHSKSLLDEKITRYLLSSLFDAVEEIHVKGICHRDLKPENVLLDKDFTPKIADLGFAIRFRGNDGAERMLRTELGTRGYMAPEIAATRRYTAKVDVFALGVISFICMAGFPPFRETTRKDWWFHKIMIENWGLFWKAHERKAKFSDTAKKLIQGMLCAEPKNRLAVNELEKTSYMLETTASKDEFKSDMRRRWKNVKQAVKEKRKKMVFAKEKPQNRKGMNIRVNEEVGKYMDARFKAGENTSVVPVDFLVANSTRQEICKAKSTAEALDVVRLQAKDCGIEMNVSLPEQYKLEDLRKLFGGVATYSDFTKYIKQLFPGQNFDDEKLRTFWIKLNHERFVETGLDIPMTDVEKYESIEKKVKPKTIPDELFCLAPHRYIVAFGYGTLMHIVRGFENEQTKKGVKCEVQYDRDHSAITLTFGIEKIISMPGDEDTEAMEIKESGECAIVLQMFKCPEGGVEKKYKEMTRILILKKKERTDPYFARYAEQILEDVLNSTAILSLSYPNFEDARLKESLSEKVNKNASILFEDFESTTL